MTASRLSVSIIFFTNGFIHANWASRLPELERFLMISHTQLGSLLFVLAIGAIVAMPFSGWLSHQFGSATVTRMTGILLCLSIGLLAISTSLFISVPVFFLLGLSNGAMDVAMNEQAVLVERQHAKPIMSSFHAFWSVGMTIGAGCGALFSKLEFSLLNHFLVIGVIGLVVLIRATVQLVPAPVKAGNENTPGFILPTRAIVPLGLIAFCGMLGEGTLVDWSAIYMSEVIGESDTMSAIAFGSFGASMMVGRVAGDFLTHHLGKKKLLMLDSLLAIAGILLVVSFASPYTTLVGFFTAGLGLSTVVPIIYTTAGNTLEYRQA